MFLLDEVAGVPAWAVVIIVLAIVGLAFALILKLDQMFQKYVDEPVCEKKNCSENHTHRVSLKTLMGPKKLFDGHPHTHRREDGKNIFHAHTGGEIAHSHTKTEATSGR